jgi:Zn-dependent protease with chaperone function
VIARPGSTLLVLGANALLVGLPMAALLAWALRAARGIDPRVRHLCCLAGFAIVAWAPGILLLADETVAFFAGASAPSRALPLDILRDLPMPTVTWLVPVLWLVVTARLLVREWRAAASLRRLRADWAPLPDEIRERLAVPPQVAAWTGPDGRPMSLPSLRGAIYLPASLMAELPPASLRAIVAHELDHARWRDALVHVCLRVVRALQWFSPGLWWIAALARHEREAAADQAALAGTDPLGRLDYARLLLDVVAHGGGGKESTADLPMTAAGDSLERRIDRLLVSSVPAGRAGRTAAALLVAGAFACPGLLPRTRLPAPVNDAVIRVVQSDRRVTRRFDREVIRVRIPHATQPSFPSTRRSR